MTTIVLDHVARRMQTIGDTAVWLAPTRTGGAVPVLHFTRTTGVTYSLALTRDELVNLYDSAFAILSASDATIEDWLDQAAAEIMKSVASMTF